MADNRTPAAWLEVLNARLDARWLRPRTGMGVLDAYFEGDHRLTFATSRFREAFGNLFAAIADNWMQIVVDSRTERLEVQGFRFGSNSADDRAWEIWQDNGMDLQADEVHEEAVKLGESYWLVEPSDGDALPRITCEHPSQVIVACAPGQRRQRLAALKKWVGEDGYVYANVYLPEGIAKYRSAEKASTGRRVQWRRRDDDPGGAHDLGVVPIIPVVNKPRMLQGGRSDIAVVLPIQDALNKLLSDMLIGSEYQAFPQRVLLGVEIPRDPTTGQPVTAAQLQFSQSRLLTFENERAQVKEFSAADLTNYVKAREHLIEGFTAKTRTPPHYVSGQMVNVSADGINAAMDGLVAVCTKATRAFSEPHEDTVRLGFLAMGDKQRAKLTSAETIWADVRSRTESQMLDAANKAKTVDLPTEVIWERYLGLSPAQITRAKTLQMIDSAFGLGEDDSAGA